MGNKGGEDGDFLYPDFADGVTQTIVGTELVERHGVELAFVQVGHRPLPLLLTQRTSGVQRISEAVTAHRRTMMCDQK